MNLPRYSIILLVLFSNLYSPLFAEKMDERTSDKIFSEGKIININDQMNGITFYHIIWDNTFFKCYVLNDLPKRHWIELYCYNQER